MIETSNKNFMNMSEKDYKEMQRIENDMFEALREVIQTKDLQSNAAKNVYEKHKAWLNFAWPTYSSEAHIGLVEMYVADERFAKYYNDRAGEGAADILKDIIHKYAK